MYDSVYVLTLFRSGSVTIGGGEKHIYMKNVLKLECVFLNLHFATAAATGTTFVG